MEAHNETSQSLGFLRTHKSKAKGSAGPMTAAWCALQHIPVANPSESQGTDADLSRVLPGPGLKAMLTTDKHVLSNHHACGSGLFLTFM